MAVNYENEEVKGDKMMWYWGISVISSICYSWVYAPPPMKMKGFGKQKQSAPAFYYKSDEDAKEGIVDLLFKFYMA